jgi:hypothetical protein
MLLLIFSLLIVKFVPACALHADRQKWQKNLVSAYGSVVKKRSTLNRNVSTSLGVGATLVTHIGRLKLPLPNLLGNYLEP